MPKIPKPLFVISSFHQTLSPKFLFFSFFFYIFTTLILIITNNNRRTQKLHATVKLNIKITIKKLKKKCPFFPKIFGFKLSL